MKVFFKTSYSYGFRILKLNNLKVIHDLYFYYLTQILFKTTFFSGGSICRFSSISDSSSVDPNRTQTKKRAIYTLQQLNCTWIFSNSADKSNYGKLIIFKKKIEPWAIEKSAGSNSYVEGKWDVCRSFLFLWSPHGPHNSICT